MSCYHPLPGWRTATGEVTIGGREPPDSTALAIPCGGCIGCNQDKAKAWALRCHLELQRHAEAAFTTLTYSDQHVPPTLEKRHLQLFLKRLRKNAAGRALRFFASGEYGERTYRPHYHAILFGLPATEAQLIEDTWGLGLCRTTPVTPARIAYVAGYTAKKAGWLQRSREERIDPTTGEVYYYQPPFIQMSRRPGIAAHAKQWPQSWRLFAINSQGKKQQVPRYLHQAYLDQATPEELEKLKDEKQEILKFITKSEKQRQAAEQIAITKQAITADKRRYA